MHIGRVELPHHPVVLAPMEDVTDATFRKLCREWGADLTYTEFVSADAVVREIGSTLRKLDVPPGDRPVVAQVYGRDPAVVADAVQRIEETAPDIIDLNAGCPVKKIAGKGAGAGLLRDPDRLVRMAEACVKRLHGTPFTVKTRLGWDDEHRDVVRLAERLQDVGVDALAVHGRTRAQMYTGQADWTLIGAIKENQRMRIPIIGNGDVDGAECCQRMFERYAVDAVMIGRAAIGRPWIFAECRSLLQQGRTLPPPTLDEQIDRHLDQLQRTLDDKGDERRAILHLRRHWALAFKALPGIRDLRVALLRADNIDQVRLAFDNIRALGRDEQAITTANHAV